MARAQTFGPLALAASILIVAGLGWWLVGRNWLQPAASVASTAVVRQEPPVPAPPGHSAPEALLARLAAFEAPAYTPLRLRGSPDETAQTFRQAMTRYARGDYKAAIAGLARAAESDPRAPHVSFFLGIALLLDGRTDDGIRQLRATIGLGDSAFLEDAHFYLAKAYLRRSDVAEARQEIERVIALDGDRRAEAEGLLADLNTIPPDGGP